MDSSLYCSCILHEKLIRQKHQLFLEKLLARQTCCFALSAQTSRLLNHIPSPLTDTVNLEFSALGVETFSRGWWARYHCRTVFSRADNGPDPNCEFSACYSQQPQIHGASHSPGISWISHWTSQDWPQGALRLLAMKAMGVTWLAHQRQSLKRFSSWGGQSN